MTQFNEIGNPIDLATASVITPTSFSGECLLLARSNGRFGEKVALTLGDVNYAQLVCALCGKTALWVKLDSETKKILMTGPIFERKGSTVCAYQSPPRLLD